MSTSKVVSLTAILSFVSGSVLAQPQASQENLKRYCVGDYLEHCGQFSPDGREVQACCRQKAVGLMPSCLMAIAVYGRSRRLHRSEDRGSPVNTLISNRNGRCGQAASI